MIDQSQWKEKIDKTYARTDVQRTRAFLAGYPEIKARIDALTQSKANALGISLELLRESETMQELEEIARAKGVDSTELFWSCVVDTAAELGEMFERRDAAIKQHLGI